MPNTSSRPQTVVITGASAGVGRATAHAFARRGARIGLLARNQQALEATRREVEDLGGEAVCCVTDVSEYDQVAAAANIVKEAYGPIDIWVNNAMVSVMAPLKQVTPREFRRVTDVTYHGQVHGTMVALDHMRDRDRGSIILVGSALAFRGIPLQAAYCGAKHAIQGFFESLRTELIHEGSNIQLSMVQLPGLNTTAFKFSRNKMPREPRPIGRIYEPEVAAEAILYAADHDEREVFVTSTVFQTIWGNKLFPAVADQLLANNGYRDQMTNRMADPNAPDNLFEPIPGDHGYKGEFTGIARTSSPYLWAVMNKWLGAALVGGLALTAGAIILGRQRSSADDDYLLGNYNRAGEAAYPEAFGTREFESEEDDYPVPHPKAPWVQPTHPSIN